MKSTTLKAWTRWLLLVLLCACMLAQTSCAKVQALSVSSSIDSGADRKSEQEEVNRIRPSYIGNQGESIESILMSTESIRDVSFFTGVINSSNQPQERKVFGVAQAEAEAKAYAEAQIYVEAKTYAEAKTETANKLPVQEENSSITLMFTGDLMCLGGQQNAVNKRGEFDFTPSFTYVKPLFQNADIVVGNLETLISDSNPYTYQRKTKDNNPNCNAMESYLGALIYAGFDAVVTANNHSLDGGAIGITETIEKLEECNLVHTGTYLNKQEQPFILYEVKGITVAILSYTEIINARNALPTQQVESFISCYSKEKVIRDVKAARECGADYVIAYNHWGVENTHEVTDLQKQHASEMAEAGVDLILGSHPHCLQEASYITTSDGRQVLCIYSMGNFVSSMTREINSDTIVLEVNLHRNKKIVYPGAIGYYPMKVIGTYLSKKYVILPVSKQLNRISNLNSMLEKTRIRIDQVIGDEISQIRF